MGSLFHNAKVGEPIRVTLEEMVKTQQATPIQTDNYITDSIVNDNIQQKSTKAMDLRFYWVQY